MIVPTAVSICQSIEQPLVTFPSNPKADPGFLKPPQTTGCLSALFVSCRNVTPEGKTETGEKMFLLETEIKQYIKKYLYKSNISKYTSSTSNKTVLSKLLTNSGHSLSSSRGSGAGPSGVASTSTSASTGTS